MPELPEVETVKNILKRDILGLTIDHIDVYYNKLIKNVSEEEFKKVLVGEQFIDIHRFGKYLVFELENYWMVAHLRMEGKYFLMHQEEKNKHDHVIFQFTNNSNLRYNDTRKFGVIYLFSKTQYDLNGLRKSYPLNSLGLEPFDEKLTVNYLKQRWSKSSLPIKSALLDQSVIAGLGNIYADEVCFMAQLHPESLCSSLSEEDYQNIIHASIQVLNKAISLGGTTIRSFQSSHEISGRFQNELCVHTKEKCGCGRKIEKIRVGGRGTYFCPDCQKLRK